MNDLETLIREHLDTENDIAEAFNTVRALIGDVNAENVEAVIVAVMARDGTSVVQHYDQDTLVGMLGSERSIRALGTVLNEHFAAQFGKEFNAEQPVNDDGNVESDADPSELVDLLVRADDVRTAMHNDPFDRTNQARLVELWDEAIPKLAKIGTVPSADMVKTIERIRRSLAGSK